MKNTGNSINQKRKHHIYEGASCGDLYDNSSLKATTGDQQVQETTDLRQCSMTIKAPNTQRTHQKTTKWATERPMPCYT